MNRAVQPGDEVLVTKYHACSSGPEWYEVIGVFPDGVIKYRDGEKSGCVPPERVLDVVRRRFDDRFQRKECLIEVERHREDGWPPEKCTHMDDTLRFGDGKPPLTPIPPDFFDRIGLHDLVELAANEHIKQGGWYIVTWINRCWGKTLPEVEPLGSHEPSRTLRESDAALILRHIRTAAAPGTIDTLENIMYVGIDAMRRYGKVFNVDELRARGEAALRAVRGETDAAAEARKKAPEGPEPLGEWK